MWPKEFGGGDEMVYCFKWSERFSFLRSITVSHGKSVVKDTISMTPPDILFPQQGELLKEFQASQITNKFQSDDQKHLKSIDEFLAVLSGDEADPPQRQGGGGFPVIQRQLQLPSGSAASSSFERGPLTAGNASVTPLAWAAQTHHRNELL